MKALSRHAFNVILPNFIKILCGILILKLAAIYLSVQDFGRLGQFMTLVAVVNMLAGGGINNGVVKLLAEAKNELERQRVIMTAGWFWRISIVVICVLLLSTWTWHVDYLGEATFFVCFVALAHILWGQTNIFNSYLIANQQTQLLKIYGLQSNILGLLFFLAVFFYQKTLISAFTGYLFFISASFLVAILRVLPHYKELLSFYKARYSQDIAKKLLHYCIVMLVGAVAIPIVQMLLRSHIAEVLGWESVGYWQAVIKISDAHLQFYGIINLSVLLPYFANLNTVQRITLTHKSVLKIIAIFIIIALSTSSILIALRELVITILYDKHYLQISGLMIQQVIGDFFKVILSLFVVVALAKGYWRIALLSELLQAIILYVSTLWLLPTYQLQAVTMAYIWSSVCTLCILGVVMGRAK